MNLYHALRCPACGPFGRRARRRNADADAFAHIAWARGLVEQTTRERRSQLETIAKAMAKDFADYFHDCPGEGCCGPAPATPEPATFRWPGAVW